MTNYLFLIPTIICFVCLVITEHDTNEKLKKGILPSIMDILVKYTLLLGVVSSMILARTT